MMSRTNGQNNTVIVVGIAVILASVWVVAHVLSLSLNRGDNVPPVSTLRTDPKGAKVLYRSLANIPELAVRRNYRELSQQTLPKEAVMFYLGVTAKISVTDFLTAGFFHEARKQEVNALEAFMEDGGRVVFAMRDRVGMFGKGEAFTQTTAAPLAPPAATPPTQVIPPNTPQVGPKQSPQIPQNNKTTPKAPATGQAPTPAPAPAPKKTAPAPGGGGTTGPPGLKVFKEAIIKKWGVDYARSPLTLNDDEDDYLPDIAIPVDEESSFVPVQWYSGYYFTDLDDNWTIHYRRDGKPVVIERSFGKGSVVLVSDSYLLSNQGLRAAPNGHLITWLLDGRSTVIFNERHLNVREDTGVATLVYRYNLQWFAGGLILIALLYVWQSTMSLVPLRAGTVTTDDAVTEGKEAHEGFTKLLQQHIPDKELLELCYNEWLRSDGKTARLDDNTMTYIKRIATDQEVLHNQKLSAEAYRRICDYIKHPPG